MFKNGGYSFLCKFVLALCVCATGLQSNLLAINTSWGQSGSPRSTKTHSHEPISYSRPIETPIASDEQVDALLQQDPASDLAENPFAGLQQGTQPLPPTVMPPQLQQPPHEPGFIEKGLEVVDKVNDELFVYNPNAKPKDESWFKKILMAPIRIAKWIGHVVTYPFSYISNKIFGATESHVTNAARYGIEKIENSVISSSALKNKEFAKAGFMAVNSILVGPDQKVLDNLPKGLPAELRAQLAAQLSPDKANYLSKWLYGKGVQKVAHMGLNYLLKKVLIDGFKISADNLPTDFSDGSALRDTLVNLLCTQTEWGKKLDEEYKIQDRYTKASSIYNVAENIASGLSICYFLTQNNPRLDSASNKVAKMLQLAGIITKSISALQGINRCSYLFRKQTIYDMNTNSKLSTISRVASTLFEWKEGIIFGFALLKSIYDYVKANSEAKAHFIKQCKEFYNISKKDAENLFDLLSTEKLPQAKQDQATTILSKYGMVLDDFVTSIIKNNSTFAMNMAGGMA